MIVEGDDRRQTAKPDDKAPATLDSSIAALDQAAERLRKLSHWFPLFSLAEAIGLAAMVVLRSGDFGLLRREADMTMFLVLSTAVALTAVAIMVAVRFDTERKQGDDLFSAISDELQHSGQPSLDVRLTLRRFLRSTEAPLLPSRSGAFVYVLVCVALSTLQVWLYVAPVK